MKDISILTFRRSIFPLIPFYINIGDGNNYSLKSGEVKKIKIEKEGTYEVCVSSYWIFQKKMFTLTGGETITVKHRISDIYYIIGLPVVVIPSILSLLGIFKIWYIGCMGIIFMLPVVIFTFFNARNYFKIKVESPSKP